MIEVRAESMSRATSSGLSTVGSRLGHLGKGMHSARKWRRSVLTNKKRKADTCWLTVREPSFFSLEQVSLILPDLFGPELIGRLVKVLGELADDPE